MTFLHHGPPTFSAGFAARALVVALLLVAFGSSARATCGDYLHVSNDVSVRQKAFAPAAPAPRPCHCPQCSEGPAGIPPSTPVTNSIDGRSPAIVTRLVAVPNQDPPRYGSSQTVCSLADEAPNVIYHPPR